MVKLSFTISTSTKPLKPDMKNQPLTGNKSVFQSHSIGHRRLQLIKKMLNSGNRSKII